VALGEVVAAPPPFGAYVEVGPLVVLGPATALDAAVHLQDPAGAWGVEVLRGGLLDGWPPPVGTELDLRLIWTGTATQPVGYLTSLANVTRWGGVTEPTVSDDPESPAPYTLVRHADLTVASWPDPTGRADLLRPDEAAPGALGLLDAFGVGLPPAGNRGALVAVALPGGRRAPRSASDWSGGWAPATRATVTLREIAAGDLPEGAAVEVTATQAAPWSVGGGWTVLQDGDVGLWVWADALANAVGAPGELGVWRGEVRTDRGARTLRVWEDRALLGPGAPSLRSATPVDGGGATLLVADLSPPDLLGDRHVGSGEAAGSILDDRFVRLDDAPDPAQVEGVWEVRSGAPARLCVVGVAPAPAVDTGAPP
jgi:hypothetical protein